MSSPDATPEMPGEADARFMAMALALGRRGLGNAWPNPAVGAVVVRDGVIVGRGWTQPGGRPHAETEALRRAGPAARGATLYATLEPCSHHGKTPPCTEAIIAAGIARVVSAIEDPNSDVVGRGHAMLRAAAIIVEVGVGAAAAQRAHAGHIRRIRDGRPHVTLKLAVSADGKAGLAGRRPAAITGEAARARVHLMRAMNDALLIGIGTALADDPLLTCRLPGLAARSPVRVVLDAALRLPPKGALARSAGETPVWVIAGTDDGRRTTEDRSQGMSVLGKSNNQPRAEAFGDPSSVLRRLSSGQALRAQGVEVLRCAAADGRIDLAAALRLLAGRGITRLLVEGGPRVAASFVAADLVDEAAILRSRKAIGADGIDALDGISLTAFTASPRRRLRDIETLGDDTIEVYERNSCSPAS
jgi:diaminohydroxyphosphoribosylaminopyrimidine deaminase / 5-amino-6-(5-phosphoribosylamino)uracil reductase